MDKLHIPVLRSADINDGKFPTYVGVISAEVLNKLFDVPRRDATKKTGYQRNPSKTRVSQLANDIRLRNVDLPTAILLSVRSPIPDGFLNDTENESFMDLSKLGHKDKDKLYVVDGQHRILALTKVIEDAEGNPNLKIPFVCMLGTDEDSEMKQFYVVNKNAKAVGTDLAYDLMKERAEKDPKLMDALIRSGKKWEILATELVVLLSKRSVWKGMIRLPNEALGETTVPSGSFIRSLRPLLTHSVVFQDLEQERQAQLLEAYWKAMTDYCVVNGMDLADKKKYGLFKGVGVSVMNSLLPFFIERIRGTGDSLFEKDSYFSLTETVFDSLEGDNSENERVEGLEFWLSGKHGAIGSFTSEAGKRILIERLKHNLPQAKYE